MSLTEKIIKNTLYFVLSQIFGFIFPIILTPFILSSIGEVQFGLYVLVLGFIGLFNLFDLSISSSFVVFISRYNVKGDFKSLNEYFNTGLLFYVVISALIAAIAFLFAEPLLSLLNIPEDMKEISLTVYNIGLLVFLISGSFMIFTSVLISIQKMYITSIIGLTAGFLNLILTVIVLKSGYGLKGLMLVQLFIVSFTSILYAILAKMNLKELRINPALISKTPLKEMSRFGAQMQVSKLATFASEKYDEFLLAYFSALNNVTYFNVANKISRVGRLIPFQIIPQIAPVASELKAKNDDEKLQVLFTDALKYLMLASAPVFIFLFVFSDLIIETWLGKGYELSSHVLRILVVGQLINMSFSAPGNSVIPNIGIPKFQMREGLIFLGINIVLSYFLIKYYGILGAAFGNVFSTIIASFYIYFSSVKFFSMKISELFPKKQFKPLLAGAVSGLISGVTFYLALKYIYIPEGRIAGIIYLIIFFLIYVSIFTLLIIKMKFIEPKDKKLIAKLLLKFIPNKYISKEKFSSVRLNEYIEKIKDLSGE
jgi:O-antigen/teichoic acid export membrane protein